jgi:hypothetical protein
MNTGSLWCSCQPLRGFVCFDVARTTKAWNYNPLFSSVLYFASPQRNMPSMMGDVVLGEKFPHPMLLDFFWLIALQRAWGVFVLTSRITSCPPKCIIQISGCMEQERNVISVEPWKGEEGNWRIWAIFRSEDLVCYWHQIGWCVEREGPLCEFLPSLTNQKRLGCDVQRAQNLRNWECP